MKPTVGVGGGTLEGIDVIFDDDENVWSPSMTTLPLPGDLGEGRLILDIDLGHYKMITGAHFVNGNPGITLFSLSGTNLLDTEEDLFGETQISDGENKQFELQRSKLMKNLKLTLSFKNINQVAWSSLKYFEFLTSPDEFLIKQKSSQLFLGSSPRDKLLFLYPYNCRTYNLTKWSCKNGQLYNNGKTLKFMEKDAFLALTDKGTLVSTSDYASLVPSFREEGGLKSSQFQVDNDHLKITINYQDYFLRPKEFPKHSFLTSNSQVDSNKIEFVNKGLFLYIYLILMLHMYLFVLFLDNRFALDPDQKKCFEFPETNGDCDANGCKYRDGVNLCSDLDGYPADSSDAIANENMVKISMIGLIHL